MSALLQTLTLAGFISLVLAVAGLLGLIVIQLSSPRRRPRRRPAGRWTH
jgi:hypothetical protein